MQQNAECGVVSDGCGGTLSCGACASPYECAGAGVPNKCGIPCQKATCGELGAQCGTPPDGCGGKLDCGTCSAGNTCGGAGVPYHCGGACEPKTCLQLGAECGAPSDGCGSALDCGGCPGGIPCAGYACACGAEGQPCCSGACKPGFTCADNLPKLGATGCTRCGGAGAIVCENDFCNVGLTATWLPEFEASWCLNTSPANALLPGGSCSDGAGGKLECKQPSVSSCVVVSAGAVCAACGNYNQLCCPAQSPTGTCNMGSCQPYNGFTYVCK